MIVSLITHSLWSLLLKRSNIGITSLVKHRLRLKPRHRLSKGESHAVEIVEKKWEEIEERVLGDHEKEEHAKKSKDKDKGKDKSKKLLTPEGENEPRNSSDSHRSAASKKSSKAKRSDGGVVMGVLAAVEGKDFLTVEAPSKALTSPKNGKQSPGGIGGDDDDDYDDDLEENAFNHPSTYQDQPWIWLPQWESHPEISAQLVEDIKAVGVEASDVGALIDDHGTVWVKRNPPDEDWDG